MLMQDISTKQQGNGLEIDAVERLSTESRETQTTIREGISAEAVGSAKMRRERQR